MEEVYRLDAGGEARYTEIETEGGLKMRGFIHIPKGAGPDSRVPMVLVLHGLMGNRIGSGKSNVEFSKILCEHGIASARFDYIGSGESDGDFIEMSILTELSDSEYILKYVQGLDFVDKDRIAVHGMSQGGLEAGLLAGTHPDEVACLSLWSPAFCIGDESFFETVSGYDKEKLFRDGYIDSDSWLIGKKYFDDAVATDSYEIAGRYKGSVQIVHGTADTVVPIRYSEKLKEVYGDRCSLITVEGANHDYERHDYNRTRLKLALEFLEKELF
ncbi:MAG: alpha/beta hydrolase [Lachnospiraceae bacterium]|nr:alpha/beta hydrolase [Lachnospiraceae bacterium]